jgi:hypothetical protein
VRAPRGPCRRRASTLIATASRVARPSAVPGPGAGAVWAGHSRPIPKSTAHRHFINRPGTP